MSDLHLKMQRLINTEKLRKIAETEVSK